MKVLVSYLGRRGGVARTATGLVQALSEASDIEVGYIASTRSEFIGDLRRIVPIAHRLEIDTFSSKPEFLIKSLLLPLVRFKVGRLVDRFHPDIVVAPGRHHWNPFLLSRLTSRGGHYVPIIHDARIHPGERYPYPKSFQRFELGRAAHVIALSNKVKSDLMEIFGIASDAIAVCELPPISKPRSDVALKAVSSPFTFLFYGRILAYKGLDVLVDAFSSLLQQHPDIHLIVAGQGELPRGTGELAAAGKVTLINRWISETEISGIFRSAHAVVLPYHEASQSGVIADAVANMLPAIVTRVGALPEQIAKDNIGLLVDAAVPEQVTAAMAEIMRPDVYAVLAKNVEAASRKSNVWTCYLDVLRAVARSPG